VRECHGVAADEQLRDWAIKVAQVRCIFGVSRNMSAIRTIGKSDVFSALTVG
jgi:hypothetical protein